MRPRRDPVLLALLVVAAIYLFWDGSRAFAQADEFWYGEIVANMLATGDVITPRLGPRADFTKPPVFFLLSLPAAALLPSFEAAMRVVPGLCFLAVLFWVHRLGRVGIGQTGARFAAVAFLLCYDQLHLHGFRSGVIEGLLALEMTWVLILNLRLRQRPEGIRWILFALALTFMTKTAFVVFPLLLTGANLALQRGALRLRRRDVAIGAAGAALVIVPWFAATLWVNGADVVRKMFFEEMVQRALHDDVAQAAGLSFGRTESFYGLRHLLTFGQPWILLLPVALAEVVRTRAAPLSNRTLLLRLCAVWLLAVLAVFTVSRGVWGWYLHSAYVPGAILVGLVLSDLWEGDARGPALGLALSALVLSPIPFAHNPYDNSAAAVPLDALLGARVGLACVCAWVCHRVANRHDRDDALRLLTRFAVGFVLFAALVNGCSTWFVAETELAPPLVGLLASTALAGGTLAFSRGDLPRRCAVMLVVLGACYLVGPLRFAFQDNERAVLAWLRGIEREGIGAGIEIKQSFYGWIILEHKRGDDYRITYDDERQILRVAPR
jgi:4-amino-4-deoxy-L-arabinose transferase-like glycosyltransferase